MATTLKMHDLLALIAGHGAQLAGASAASIYRLDVGEDGGTTMTMLYPEGEIGSDAESAYALMICQTRIARSAQPEGPDAPVVFGVPLMTQLGVWGALCMLSPEPVAIPDEHLSVLLAFADTATLALENAQLYEQTRRESTANATLLREMHHRVRNNLQIVAALLSIQANYQSNPAVAEPLREAVARVQAIASVHDLLSGGGVVTTTLRAVLERVVSQTMSAVKSPELDVDISIDCAEIIIDSRQATILALLVTECITNALLHAFAGRATGRIEIVARCSDADGEAMIAVLDDGIGLNERALPALDHGMGTQIVTTLASADLGGSFTLEPNLPSGTRAVLRFALRPLPGQ
jgi:two-component sensor histidine kinase